MTTSQLETLIAVRDRFIGFAFAASHLLLEVDDGARITFVTGARCGLVEGGVETLIGHSLFDYFPEAEQPLLRMLLQRLLAKGKLDQTHLVMRSLNGNSMSVLLGACRLPNYPDRSFLSVSIRGQGGGRGAGSCIPELGRFLPVLESRLIAADAIEISQALSMVLIEGLRDRKGGEELRRMLEAYLLSISAGGDGAVRLADDYYAVLHGEDAALEDIRQDITQLLADTGAPELAESLQLWRISIEKSDLPVSDVARAITFTLRTFAAENPRGDFRINTIESAVDDLLKTTVVRVRDARKTLEARDFRLFFQPIVHLEDGRVQHAEALIRLGDSKSPGEFVTFTKRVGLNSELDLLVIHEVLEQLRLTLERRQDVPDIAINISATSFDSRLFVDQFQEILRPYGELSQRLLVDVIDITALQDFNMLKSAVDWLKRMGVRVCLDDVGCGSSVFAVLNRVPFDFAKLDGNALRKAMTDARDHNILQSILHICAHLGVGVIAEQIETESQRKFLRRLGVDFGQGFLFGRPTAELPVLERPRRAPARRCGNRVVWE